VDIDTLEHLAYAEWLLGQGDLPLVRPEAMPPGAAHHG
jgi:hypothetical protein